MRATGIVRRIDDLGRVVIPKEIRRTMRLHEGAALEIFTDRDGQIVLKKYSPVGELSDFASQLCDAMYKATGSCAAICDRDAVIAASGSGKKELVGQSISGTVQKIMDDRGQFENRGTVASPIENSNKFSVLTAAPVITDGDVTGCVMFVGGENSGSARESESCLAQTAAMFLGKHAEG